MDLKDTALLMSSEDYKDRLCAEYAQLTIRMQKLQRMLHQMSEEKPHTMPNGTSEMMVGQLRAMMNYQQFLVARAEWEGIPLPKM